MPLNTFNNKAPFVAKIKSVKRIVGELLERILGLDQEQIPQFLTNSGPKATGDTCHIIIETSGKIPFWEGQSYGVIPPGGCPCAN